MPKAIAFTMLIPIGLVTVIYTAASFRLIRSGLWRIAPVIDVNWNGGAKARFGSVTVGCHSANWLFEKGIISDDGLISESPLSMPALSSFTKHKHLRTSLAAQQRDARIASGVLST